MNRNSGVALLMYMEYMRHRRNRTDPSYDPQPSPYHYSEKKVSVPCHCSCEERVQAVFGSIKEIERDASKFDDTNFTIKHPLSWTQECPDLYKDVASKAQEEFAQDKAWKQTVPKLTRFWDLANESWEDEAKLYGNVRGYDYYSSEILKKFPRPWIHVSVEEKCTFGQRIQKRIHKIFTE